MKFRLALIALAGFSLKALAPPLVAAEARTVKRCARADYRVVNPVPVTSTLKPEFPLDKKQTYFEKSPVRAVETEILDLMSTGLFPAQDGFDPAKAGATLDLWMKDVDAFLLANEGDPAVQELVKKFVLDLGNKPDGVGYLPGDSAWDTPRKFVKWTDFYDSPRYHDMSGNLLRTEGNPITDAPEKISGADFDNAPKMYVQVMGNLRAHEGFAELVRENTMTPARALPQISYIRREFLQLRLIRMGEKMWKEERALGPK